MLGERLHLSLSSMIGNAVVSVTLEDVVHVENIDRNEHEHYINVLLSPHETDQVFRWLCAVRGIDTAKIGMLTHWIDESLTSYIDADDDDLPIDIFEHTEAIRETFAGRATK